MTMICARCGRGMGTKPGPEDAVTHGMCQECLERELASVSVSEGVRASAVRMDLMLSDGSRTLVAAEFDGEGRPVRASLVPEGQS